MYAIEMKDYGDVDVFAEVTDAKTPDIKPSQVLVKQHATAIDPYDVKFRAGVMGTSAPTPLINGSSVAGDIIAVGSEVSDFHVGDRVAASPHLKSYAEFVAVSSKQLAKIPDGVSYETAAAVALGGQTGYQMMTTDLDVRPGESVLIHGGAGSVGFTAIQVAQTIGAGKIYTTASGESAVFLKSFNPHLHVIDYKKESLATVIKDKVDVVLDTIGGKTLTDSLNVLQPEGRLVSIVDNNDDPRVTNSFMKSNGQQLAALLQMVASGDVKVNIAEVAPFNVINLKEFHSRQHVLGKLVLKFS
ncbi:NADP-dependent oxidoreductase [Leuconostoc falkenbergense]|uniref:NADP-dependent oxidoreductase n=1 Tax=Leuconostoc falkenbergense TaxID=2766470 RepID=A0ABT7RX58_9LACO|nr:NADP-dependent oxidoreductase [Leuconostoc falkenbergense]MDM7645886.1 NADP-dependent oxidoreductase [Leuconostoc falkenbergense]